MSQNQVKIRVTDLQKKILVIFGIIAILFTVVAFIMWGTVKGIKPNPTVENFSLANENDYDYITIEIEDQYLVDISVTTNDYVNVALFTQEEFNDKHDGNTLEHIH